MLGYKEKLTGLGLMFFGLLAVSCGQEPPALVDSDYGNVPLSFEENKGQTDSQVQFMGRARGYNLYLAGTDMVFDVVLKTPGIQETFLITPSGTAFSAGKSAQVKLSLLGANPKPKSQGEGQLGGVSNYLIGNDPSKWVTHVAQYEKVRYLSVYKGIDVLFYGTEQVVEHDFIVAPKANPALIRMGISGSQKIAIKNNGDLAITLKDNFDLTLKKPTVYQMVGDKKVFISASYSLSRDKIVSFKLGGYDRNRELVIDPATLTYSSFLGGARNDITWGVAVDSSGNAYTVGYTKSTDFPATAGSLNTNTGNPDGVSDSSWDAYVTKLNSSGTSNIFTTYLGGTGNDLANSIQVDSIGNTYVVGYTTSTDFPVKSGVFQATHGADGGGYDAFVTKLNSAGTSVTGAGQYSTYLGGTDFDRGAQVALDTVSSGCTTPGAACVVVVGTTNSPGLNAGSPVQSLLAGGAADAFVASINASGTSKTAFTYIGGSGRDLGTGVALDASGNVYVVGETRSFTFTPILSTTAAPFKNCLSGGAGDTQDAFLAKLPSTLASYTYSGCLGGSAVDGAAGVALDTVSANCTIRACPALVGTTTSLDGTTNFTHVNAYQTANAGGKDVYIAELNASTVIPASFNFMTFFGGTADDEVLGFQNIAADGTGKMWVTGKTQSAGFISSSTNAIATTGGGNNYPDQTTFSGATSRAFVMQLGSAGTGNVLNFATYLGGSIAGSSGGSDIGVGIALKPGDNTAAYVTGVAATTNFPISSSSVFDFSPNGGLDGFIAKVTQPVVANNAPVAGTDSYETVGNTLLEVSSASAVAGPKIFVSGNVLANDNNGDGGSPGVGVTISPAGTFATTNGSITIASNGTFTYLSNVGYTGADAFTYTVSDGIDTATGTINFNVVAHKVWYVKNNGSAGDGRSSSPFNTLAAAVTASAANDTIFVFAGDGTTTNQNAGAVLKNTQRLVGEGVALDVPVTVNSVVTPVLFAAGVAPLIGNSGGNGVTLASANTLKGFTVSNSSGTAILGSNVGTLVISTLAVNTNGAGISLTGTTSSSVNVVISQTNSSGGTTNVLLSSLSGTVNLGTGSLSGASGNALNVANSTANISYAGSVSNSSSGISLTSNTGATISLSGTLTLNISTGANAAFTATGGGTVTATASSSVLNTTTGTALNVVNTTIGVGGLKFQSISSSGGSNPGIVLNNTGTIAGLTVNGDGTNTTVGGNFTGGTITNKTGNAITLTNTKDVVLRRIRINGTITDFGIRGFGVNGFTLEYSLVNGTLGNASNEGSIYFGDTTTNGLIGSATFTNNAIGGGAGDNVSIQNTSSTTVLSFTGNTFQLNQNTAFGNDSLLIQASNSGTTVNSTLTNNTFLGAKAANVQFVGGPSTIMSVTMSGNALSNTHPASMASGELSIGTTGTLNFDIQNNTFRDAYGPAVALGLGTGGTLLSGKFNNNTIGVAATLNSGSKTGAGIKGSCQGAGTLSLTLNNNQIHQYNGVGMDFNTIRDSCTGNFTIKSNTVDTPGISATGGLIIRKGGISTDTVQVCADIKSNNMSTGDPLDINDILVRALGSGTGYTFVLPGYVMGPTLLNVQNFILSNNNIAGTTVSATVSSPSTAAVFVNNALTSCSTP